MRRIALLLVTTSVCGSFLGPVSAGCIPPASGLVSWWSGDGTATDLQDGNHGGLQNGATYAAGVVGQSFSFNGSGQYVQAPDGANLKFGTNSPLTVCLWAYRTNSNSIMHIVGKRNGCAGGNSFNYQMGLDNSGGFGLEFGAANPNQVSTHVDLPLNSWWHLAGTFDGTTFRFYTNGTLAASAAGMLGPIDSAPLRIGSSGDCASFAGQLDEVQLYNRALSLSEIQAIYNAGSAGVCKPAVTNCITPPSGLVSWWPGDGTPSDIQDGDSGTLQNGATYAAGLVGAAFSFSGSGQYVQVPDAANLQFATNSPITISLWAYRTNNNSIMHILGKRSGCVSGSSINYQMVLDDSAGYGLLFGGASLSQVNTHVDLPLNSWWHLAGTFDGTTFRFYTNGGLAALAGGSLGPPNSAPLRIGSSGDCASFAGQLDEVQLYNRALSLSEIQAIYNAGSAGVCKAILAIAHANATQVAVSWPGGVSNYLLQSVSNLPASATNWMTVTDTPVVVAGRFTVTNNATGQRKFYRLMH